MTIEEFYDTMQEGDNVSYGNPMTANPLDFRPDPECCTPFEIANWEEDCTRVRAGLEPGQGNTSGWLGPHLHVTGSRWGIGTSILRGAKGIGL